MVASTNFRGIILAGVAGYVLQKLFKSNLLPWGPARRVLDHNKLAYANIDHSNDSLQAKHGKLQKIFERVEDGQTPLMKGAETIVFGTDGTMYVLTEESNLISLTDFESSEDGLSLTAKANFVKDLGIGRPLGGKFTPDGQTLYIADAILGLTRLKNPHDPASKVELISNAVMDGGVMTPILYADDVDIGPISGKVFFSDASTIAPDRLLKSKTWDTLYASKMDLARGVGTGRLLQYDPSTEEVSVLARNIHFANGVAVFVGKDQEETIFLSETFGPRLLKYELKAGGLKGLEVFLDNKDMTGYVDGLDCTGAKCYAVMPSAISPVHKLWSMLPAAVDVFFRTFILTLPRRFAPPVQKYGGVLEVDPSTGAFRYFQDPNGLDIAMLCGVTEHDGKLYLGSLENDYIGVYNLESNVNRVWY
jgi:sugar lactone lactonase YvrE